MNSRETVQILIDNIEAIMALAYHSEGWAEMVRIGLTSEEPVESRGLHHSFHRYKLALIVKTFYESNPKRYHRISGKFVTERLCKDVLSFLDNHGNIKERLSIKGQRAVRAAIKGLAIKDLSITGNIADIKIGRDYIFLKEA